MALIWKDVCFKGGESFGKNLIRECFRPCCSPKIKSSILDNLKGKIHFGELTALMGPSGAGKSTLLKFITQGKNYGGCKGNLFVDIDTKQDIRASFITQDEKDHLLLNLTVYESIHYASEIKNPKSTPKSRHEEIIQQILTEMELDNIRDTLAEKCSGGEKKRLAIALELTSELKPNFLFLDEPTSGLDSYSGFNVVYTLRKLAHTRNMAIVTTVHQPSYEMLELFDQVYVISKSGNCIYNGPPGKIQECLADYSFTASASGNPADNIIKVASSVNREEFLQLLSKPTDEFEMRIRLIESSTQAQLTQNKQICEQMTADMKLRWLSEIFPRDLELESLDEGLCSKNSKFNFKNLWVLTKRAVRTSILRQHKLILIRFSLHAVVALVLAILYKRNLGLEPGCLLTSSNMNETLIPNISSKKADIREEDVTGKNVKFQFFSLLFLMFAALMPTVLTFPAEIKLFLSEHRNGWYTTGTYYLSKTLVEIPIQFVFTFFYIYFLYWYSQQIGMETWYGGIFGFMSWRYCYFLLITILSCFIAQGLGYLIGILCVNSFNITVILSSSVLLFLFLFSGFFVKIFYMGEIAKLITYFSFVRFSFESLLMLLYGFDRCKNPNMSAVLYIFDLDTKNMMTSIFWLIGHLLVTRVLAFILLKKLAEPNFLSPRKLKDCLCDCSIFYKRPWSEEVLLKT